MKSTCEVCAKTFKTHERLKKHIVRVHSVVEGLECPQCAKPYRNDFLLSQHVIQVHNFKVVKCHLCFKTVRQTNLKTHMETSHTEVKNLLSCRYCSKLFRNKISLKKHEYLIHVRDKSYDCDQCSQTFKMKHHLKNHMLKHSGERAFKCDVCEKSFGRKQILDTHMLSHTGERAFYCDKCQKDFLRKTDLNRHNRKFHPELTDTPIAT